MKKINIFEDTKKVLAEANVPEEKQLASIYVAAWIQDNAERLEIVNAEVRQLLGGDISITCSMLDIVFEHCNKDSFFSLVPFCESIGFTKDKCRGEYLQISFRLAIY